MFILPMIEFKVSILSVLATSALLEDQEILPQPTVKMVTKSHQKHTWAPKMILQQS